MVKTRIINPKPGFTVGMEYDHLGIRAARMAADGKGGYAVDGMEEIPGAFGEDANLIEGLRLMKSKLNISPKDALVACLSGKQVFASEITFRRLPTEEMEQALRLDLRKSVHFEVNSATLDYQILTEGESKGESVQVLVVLAANGLLGRQLQVLDKANLKVEAVDALPIATANALWTWLGKTPGEHAHVILNMGPQISNIIIDGDKSPFFNRNVPFPAEELFHPNREKPVDREKRIQALGEEISRSLAFYEKGAFASGIHELLLMGQYLDFPGLEGQLRRFTGLPTRRLDIPKKMGHSHDREPGRFDLSVALALRGEPL